LPKLAFLSLNAQLNIGDRIVTSGHGGVFPAGLPVGQISDVADGVIRVNPFADFYRLEYVRIITEFPGEAASEVAQPSARPSRTK
jgi:rod shape-determining protein MreC